MDGPHSNMGGALHSVEGAGIAAGRAGDVMQEAAGKWDCYIPSFPQQIPGAKGLLGRLVWEVGGTAS